MKAKDTIPYICILSIALVNLACGQSAATAIPQGSAYPPTSQASPVTIAPGDITHSLEYGGVSRQYILHIPSNYNPDQPAALVLAFHGFDLNGSEMARISGLSEQADLSGFIIAYPDGSGTKKSWNGGDCCGEAALKKTDDIDFVRTLIQEIENQVRIDPNRIYATGFSNGAIFSYRLACELADQIAAIAPIGATLGFSPCQPSRPIPLIHFHGTADRLNPYDGGESQGGKIIYLSVTESIQTFVTLNQCPAAPTQETVGSIIHDVYAPCAGSSSVELYTIQGGEHAWPGGEPVTPQIGIPTTEIDASQLMLDFFTNNPKP